MPYRYLEDVAVADAAFEAWAPTREELFAEAAEATLKEMVENPESVLPREHRKLQVGPDPLDLLLYGLLQELIYYKDSDQLLLRVKNIRIEETEEGFMLEADAEGERLDPRRHNLAADVKAVTMHRFQVKETAEGWRATVVLDI